MNFIGSDGKTYEDPCTSRAGKLKQRWPSMSTAVFVVDQRAAKRKKQYAYECPKCSGFHLTAVRNEHGYREHRRQMQLAAEQRNLGKCDKTRPAG